MNRLSIFVFWEKNGIVRDYIFYYLQGLKEVTQKIIVVVNGEISSEGEEKLRKIGIIVLKRENVGVDFWAYKTGLDSEINDLTNYDEIILANCSCYGPIYPFSEMFFEMQKREIDFWGITEWPENAFGYKGTWILSYFMVFRKNIFTSASWQSFWDNLTPVFSREECIEFHESKFTSYLTNYGFKYDVYCHNSSDFVDVTIECPDILVIDQKCPIIKRKAFCTDYDRFLTFHRGNASKRVFDFIKVENLYDINLILDDLLQTQHYYHIKNLLHLNFFLPSDQKSIHISRKPRIALCFHIYYEELLDRCLHYVESVPEYADIFITTPKTELLPKIEQKCKEKNINNVSVKLIIARGRAESAFLVACKDFIDNYDYVCIAHDKKSTFLKPGIIGKEFGFHNLDALLKTPDYVKNIIGLFESNSKLGMLVPINLVYANFRDLYGAEWGQNYDNTVKLLQDFKINVPIAADIPPICPMGAMFWFRPQCLKKLFEKSWEFEDFPDEPLPLDGSLIHAIERAYPFFVQDAGFLTGWVSTIEDAENHLTNISYLYRNCNIERMALIWQITHGIIDDQYISLRKVLLQKIMFYKKKILRKFKKS